MTSGDSWSQFIKEIQREDVDGNKKIPINNSENISMSTNGPRSFFAPPSNSEEKEDTDNEISKAEKSYINKLLNTKLVETQACDIEMLREDPSNPLHSAKTFQDLNLLVTV